MKPPEPEIGARRLKERDIPRLANGLRRLGLLLFFLGFAGRAWPSGLLVWNFDQGVVNGRGGQYNVYAREPSWARTYLDPSVHRPSSGHSLRVTVHREAQGFCGLWLDFYPRSAVPRRFLDASPYRFLSFWIKGQKGGEDFDLQLADSTGQQHEDATRPLHAYLRRGVTTEWQEVLIPLADFRGLDLRQLVQVTLNFTTPGDYRFYLEDVAFKSEKRDAVGAPKALALKAPAGASEKARHAMWVWNTQDLFDSPGEEETKRFFEFCSAAKIREIYLSLTLTRREAAASRQFNLRRADLYRKFLGDAHQEGLTVHGLAGTPEWAVRENHPFALAAVEAVLSFNRSSPPGARFDGVHFDVEPYLLPGYSYPEYRAQILAEFLEMVSQCTARVRAEPKLHFGCDVPAWFYPAGELERQRLTVTFRGEEKTVGEHLTDMLGTVTIMDYRNRADGAGGIIAAGIPALAYAASKGKKILVGLETSLEPESTHYFVVGLPREEFWTRLAASELRDQLYYGDWRLATFSDEINIHIGLMAPEELQGATRGEFESALTRLARQLSAATDPKRFPANSILEEARAALAGDSEWKGFETFELKDADTQRTIMGFRAVHRMPPDTTFHGLGPKVFAEERRSVLEWLSRYPSFAGLAVHSYESFRRLVEGR